MKKQLAIILSGKEINGWIFTINAVDGTSIDREYGY